MTVTAVPESELLLYSVQRSSELILTTHGPGVSSGPFHLRGVTEIPTQSFATAAAELWATDYDHLVRVSPVTWDVLDLSAWRARLTGAGCSSGTSPSIPERTAVWSADRSRVTLLSWIQRPSEGLVKSPCVGAVASRGPGTHEDLGWSPALSARSGWPQATRRSSLASIDMLSESSQVRRRDELGGHATERASLPECAVVQ